MKLRLDCTLTDNTVLQSNVFDIPSSDTETFNYLLNYGSSINIRSVIQEKGFYSANIDLWGAMTTSDALGNVLLQVGADFFQVKRAHISYSSNGTQTVVAFWYEDYSTGEVKQKFYETDQLIMVSPMSSTIYAFLNYNLYGRRAT